MVDFFMNCFSAMLVYQRVPKKNKTESVCSKGRVEVDIPPCSLYNCHLRMFLPFHGWFVGSMLIFHGDMVHVKLPCMVYHTNQPNEGNYTIHGSYGKRGVLIKVIWFDLKHLESRSCGGRKPRIHQHRLLGCTSWMFPLGHPLKWEIHK